MVSRIEGINLKNSDDLNLLRRANDYAKAVEEQIEIPLDTFLLEPIAEAFDTPMRANFACLMAYPMKYVDEARVLKVGEMKHDYRIPNRLPAPPSWR